MNQSSRLAVSRQLLLLFLATTVAPALGLLWLGWQIVEQDRSLERQRLQDQRGHAAARASAALQGALRKVEELVNRAPEALTRAVPPGIAIAVFAPSGLEGGAGVMLPFYPPASHKSG